MNCMSVIEYAVEALHVDHIIVCGHYGCGGVQAAMQNIRSGLAGNWIVHIREICRKYARTLERFDDEQAEFRRLCELNVVEQVNRLCRSTVVENAWSRGIDLCVHGWIYQLEDGLLHDLELCIATPDEVEPMIEAAASRESDVN